MNFKIKGKRQNNTIAFQNLLTSIVNEYNLEKLFTIESLREIWSEIVGDIMSSHTIPYKLHNAILFIAVDHPVYANEIIMIKDLIIQKVIKKGSFVKIREIRAEVKKYKDKAQ